MDALEEKAPVAAKRAPVLGAGWAAQAVVYGLITRGAQVTVLNCSDGKGRALADDLGATYGGDMGALAAGSCDIPVNTVPTNRNDPTARLIDPATLTGSDTVMDINIHKAPTQLLIDAKAVRAMPIGGIRMLVLRGVFAFELFSGHKAPVEIMQAAVGSGS